MLIKYTTENLKETQKLGKELAEEILLQKLKNPPAGGATVLALYGDLGGGKTTFLQGFAKGLKVKEKILSPTFVIMKNFKIPQTTNYSLQTINAFYHFDCYKINRAEEIQELGFAEIIKNPKNIVAIEWPEKIKKYLPKECLKIKFKFIDQNKREIVFNKPKEML